MRQLWVDDFIFLIFGIQGTMTLHVPLAESFIIPYIILQNSPSLVNASRPIDTFLLRCVILHVIFNCTDMGRYSGRYSGR